MDHSDYKKIKSLIEPVQTADELNNYIIKHFNIEFPWDIVDEESTSSSLKFIWQVYKTMLTGQGDYRHVVAASRGTAKTLSTAIVQYFSLVHFRRDGLHLAATRDQSYALIKYIDQFLRNPTISAFTDTDSVSMKRLNLPPNDFTLKQTAALQVAAATRKGTNSQRASCLSFDEIDLTPPEILSEAAMIADPSTIYRPDGTIEKFNTMFIYLSSRKTNEGPLQELIDEAEYPGKTNNKVILHKWSSVDWMEECTEDIYGPEKPTNIYINTETLEQVWGETEFKSRIPDALQQVYKKYSLFENCKQCPALTSCLGRSIKQRGKSFMLRQRDWVGTLLASTKSASAILAQILNWKPEVAGIVYATFSPLKHVKAAAEFYEWCTGERYNPNNITTEEYDKRLNMDCTYEELQEISPSKEEIYQALVKNGYTMIAGVDWGFSPDPATVVVGAYHKKRKRFAVLHCDSGYNYSNNTWAEYCCKNIFNRFPVSFVAPDQADPASNTYFAKFYIKSLGPKDKPSRIATGVSQVRGLLFNPNTQDINFCILDDSQEEDQNKQIIYEMQHWTHAKDAIGRWRSDKFDEHSNNHFCDPTRYMLHPFLKNVNISISIGQGGDSVLKEQQQQAIKDYQEKKTLENQLNDYFKNEHGITKAIPNNNEEEKTSKTSTGGIKFSF